MMASMSSGNSSESQGVNGVAQGMDFPAKQVDCFTSLTDVTLEQAVLKLQEIEKENLALRDSLYEQNQVMKQQYEALFEWRKKQGNKFEQTNAVITALKEENQELQVKVMTLEDKKKEYEQQIQRHVMEERHLLRQKALSDQRAFNIGKLAEQQGVTGIDKERIESSADTDDMVFVGVVGQEEIIAKLEESVKEKDEHIAHLRAEGLQKDEELNHLRASAQQLLKDMVSQQKLKEHVEGENRMLSQRIMKAERDFHQQMESVIVATKREMDVGQLQGAIEKIQRERTASGTEILSFPENVEDLGKFAHPSEGDTSEKMDVGKLLNTLKKESKDKLILSEEIKTLKQQMEELNIKHTDTEQQLEDSKQEVSQLQVEASRLGQEYEQKLMNVAQQSSELGTMSIQASETEDVSILRSQVLCLIKEVDELHGKLSASMVAIQTKDQRIMDMEQMQANLHAELDGYKRNQYLIQEENSRRQKSQQEYSEIKQQNQQLQDSFYKLVTDYKELVETFEAYRKEAELKISSAAQSRKSAPEEINRLTAQVIAADQAITVRDEEITNLKKSLISSNKKTQEEIQLLKLQADVFKNDFTAERESRTRLAEGKAKLMEEMKELKRMNTSLKEGYNQREINEIKRRLWANGMNSKSNDGAPLYEVPGNSRVPHQFTNSPGQAVGGYANQVDEEFQSFQELPCPKCNVLFPELDSLQLHVAECINK